MSCEVLLIVMCLVAAAAKTLEKTTHWAKCISGVAIVILTALALSTADLIPHSSPLYDFFLGPGLSIGIALILMSFDYKTLLLIPKQLILLFVFGTLCTSLAAITVGLISIPLLGTDGIKLAAQLAASYIGGSENAAAMKSMLNIPSNMFVNVFAVDHIVTSLWMVCCIFLSRFYLRKQPDATGDVIALAPASAAELANPGNIFASVCLALCVHVLSQFLYSKLALLSPLVYVSVLALVLGQVPAVKKYLAPAYAMGYVLFILFFFSVGALSNLRTVTSLPLFMVLMPFLIVAIHGVLLFAYAVLRKISFLETALVSQTLIGGPSTAFAFGQAKDWPKGSAIGLILGLFSYCIANFFGLAVFYSITWLHAL